MRAAILWGLLALPLIAESVAGLQWTEPAGWKDVGTAPMRAATYQVPMAAGDHGKTECVVYFFGQGQGGPVDANMERWNGQFLTGSGKTAPAQIHKRVVHGLPVTTIDVSGAAVATAPRGAVCRRVLRCKQSTYSFVTAPQGAVAETRGGPAASMIRLA